MAYLSKEEFAKKKANERDIESSRWITINISERDNVIKALAEAKKSLATRKAMAEREIKTAYDQYHNISNSYVQTYQDDHEYTYTQQESDHMNTQAHLIYTHYKSFWEQAIKNKESEIEAWIIILAQFKKGKEEAKAYRKDWVKNLADKKPKGYQIPKFKYVKQTNRMSRHR